MAMKAAGPLAACRIALPPGLLGGAWPLSRTPSAYQRYQAQQATTHWADFLGVIPWAVCGSGRITPVNPRVGGKIASPSIISTISACRG